MANGIAVGEVTTGQGLIDDPDRSALVILVGVPDAALQQRNAEDAEILGTDEIESKVLVIGRRLADDLEAGVEAVVGRSGV